jgi:hypothetical protein
MGSIKDEIKKIEETLENPNLVAGMKANLERRLKSLKAKSSGEELSVSKTQTQTAPKKTDIRELNTKSEFLEKFKIGMGKPSDVETSVWKKAKEVVDEAVNLGWVEPYDFGAGKSQYTTSKKAEKSGLNLNQIAESVWAGDHVTKHQPKLKSVRKKTDSPKAPYLIVETWNGEGYSEDNMITEIKSFSSDKEASEYTKSLIEKNQSFDEIESYDNGWGWDSRDDNGSYQYFKLTPDDYGIIIFTNVNEVKVLNYKDYIDAFQIADRNYGANDFLLEDAENGKDRYFFSSEDLNYTQLAGDTAESDYQFEIIKNPLAKKKAPVKKTPAPKEKLKTTLLGSSGTPSGIGKLITKFYMGSPKELVAVSDTEWEVHGKKGKQDGVRVVKKGQRYRFESIGDHKPSPKKSAPKKQSQNKWVVGYGGKATATIEEGSLVGGGTMWSGQMFIDKTPIKFFPMVDTKKQLTDQIGKYTGKIRNIELVTHRVKNKDGDRFSVKFIDPIQRSFSFKTLPQAKEFADTLAIAGGVKAGKPKPVAIIDHTPKKPSPKKPAPYKVGEKIWHIGYDKDKNRVPEQIEVSDIKHVTSKDFGDFWSISYTVVSGNKKGIDGSLPSTSEIAKTKLGIVKEIERIEASFSKKPEAKPAPKKAPAKKKPAPKKRSTIAEKKDSVSLKKGALDYYIKYLKTGKWGIYHKNKKIEEANSESEAYKKLDSIKSKKKAPAPKKRSSIAEKKASVKKPEKPTPAELKNFYDYALSFYGNKGIYGAEFFGTPATLKEVKEATKIYLNSLTKEKTWGQGDSLDRERVRDIIINEFRAGNYPKYKKGDTVHTKSEITGNSIHSTVQKVEWNDKTKKYKVTVKASFNGRSMVLEEDHLKKAPVKKKPAPKKRSSIAKKIASVKKSPAKPKPSPKPKAKAKKKSAKEKIQALKKNPKFKELLKGENPKHIEKDLQRKAKHAGKRISKDGNVYYEYRRSKSDIDRRIKL